METSHKVLLVEDNPQITQMYSVVLIKSGYELVVASNAQEAFDQAKVFHPEVILLDIMLPGDKTGLDILMAFRTDPLYGCMDARIAMLTNLGLTEKLEKMYEEYADRYIIKAEIVPHDLPDIIASMLAA